MTNNMYENTSRLTVPVIVAKFPLKLYMVATMLFIILSIKYFWLKGSKDSIQKNNEAISALRRRVANKKPRIE